MVQDKPAGVKTFSVKNEDRDLVQEFVDIHLAKQKKAKEEGRNWKQYSYSSTLVEFMKAYVKSNTKEL
jgi:hypothetical protein